MELTSQWEEEDGLYDFIVTKGGGKHTARAVGTNMQSSGLYYGQSVYVWDNLWSQIKSIAEGEKKHKAGLKMKLLSPGATQSLCTQAQSTPTSLLTVLLMSQDWMGWFVRAYVLLEGGVSPWQPTPSLVRSIEWQRVLSSQDRSFFTLRWSLCGPGLTLPQVVSHLLSYLDSFAPKYCFLFLIPLKTPFYSHLFYIHMFNFLFLHVFIILNLEMLSFISSFTNSYFPF